MQGVIRAACIAYAVLLGLLLLSEDPSRVVGLHGRIPAFLRMIGPAAHAISFAVLAVLALWVRWPVARWGIVLILIVYGSMTEILQGLIPHRTPEWMDWFQDMAGIALGTAFCWTMAIVGGRLARSRKVRKPDVSSGSEEWRMIERTLSRPLNNELSWWR